MKALALLGVLLTAKTIVLAGHGVPVSNWDLAYFWPDLCLSLLFAALELSIRRQRAIWVLYGLTAAYTAGNVPLQLLFGSPLTWPMARAAGGALSDSIRYYVNWQNGLSTLAVLAAACLFPAGIILRSHSRSRRLLNRTAPMDLALAGVALAAAWITFRCGRQATGQLSAAGLHRNACITLAASAFPRITAKPTAKEWRLSPFEPTPPPAESDLTPWRGQGRGRNVVLLLLESTGAQYLRLYGAAEDPTPHLTRLATASILFENAYAVYPESIKGLFSVVCSRYPAFDTTPDDYASVRTPSLAQILAQQGYRTALFHSGRFIYLGMQAIIRHRGFELLADAGEISGQRQSSFGVDEAATVRRMLAWIDGLNGERFFLTYLPIAGHHPYVSDGHGPFPDSAEPGLYRNALYEGDAALGLLLDGLRERGLFENTMFAVAGDHAEAFEQHPGNVGHTLFIYEENVHVPLLFAAPGLFRAQHRVARIASLLDLTPTILDLLGLPASPEHDGSSLLPARQQLALFFTDYSLPWLGLRDGAWKFIEDVETGGAHLFDLAHDPNEQVDLSACLPARVAFYQERLRAWSAAQKARYRR
ncbi:MAG: sulfatase-like hydrolase/transferase [Verrucomicrobiota bacterium]